MKLIDLQTFVQVAESGSLTAAAKVLALPKSTVSRRVARLEDALGLALLTRTGRRISLTEAGKRLQARTSAPLRDIRDAGRELIDASGEPSGELRITAAFDLGSSPLLADLLIGFRRAYPGVLVEFELTNRIVNLATEGFDIALRPGHITAPDLIARKLGEFTGALYASPAFVAENGQPEHTSDLSEYSCIGHPAAARAGKPWLLHNASGEVQAAAVRPVFFANDFNLITRAALEGLGIGTLPCMLGGPLVAQGRLVQILEGWGLESVQFQLVWPPARHLSPRVRAFVDYAVAHVREHGLFTPGAAPE